MFKLHGMVAVEQNDCWAKWMLKDELPLPNSGSFDLPVVQNLREELMRCHKLSMKETPINWLAFGIWQEEAIKRSSTAKQVTLAGRVLKLQGQLEGAEWRIKDTAASAPAPNQIAEHGSPTAPVWATSGQGCQTAPGSAAPGQGCSNKGEVPLTPQTPVYQPLGISQPATQYQLFNPSSRWPYKYILRSQVRIVMACVLG